MNEKNKYAVKINKCIEGEWYSKWMYFSSLSELMDYITGQTTVSKFEVYINRD